MARFGKALLVACALIAGLAASFGLHAQSGKVVGVGESGYTCCNFHPDGDWVSDANWSYLPKVPAGTPIRILGYGDNRVSVQISGRPMFLGLDYGRKMHVRDWAQRMVVAEDPNERIATWPDAVREAIEQSRVVVGMSKEQVIVSLGYPPAHATPSLDSPQWKYWRDTHGTYVVVWDDAGYVKDVTAPAQIRAVVLNGGGDLAPAAGVAASQAVPIQLKDLEGLLAPAGGGRK